MSGLPISSMMKGWFSGLLKATFRSKEIVSLWVLAAIGDGSRGAALISVINRVVFTAITCILALGGAIMGAIHGAITGQTTETGLVTGAGIGCLAGAIAAIQLMDLGVDGQSLSKVAFLGGMVNGTVFMEWVSSAVLKAYHWQVSNLETTYREISGIYDIAGAKGLSHECIQRLPQNAFRSSNMIESCNDFCCSICLQELKEGECARELPTCRHFFHMACIDQWLKQQSSCPMCRTRVDTKNT
ncbi:NEP1-interacting protein-like 1 isoform X2 [Prunus yedoensis var. nudiflora]|uniref:NEP1-interacting protein-like 1 isoform X2 n=1 Tax=Prunus yedoensis var. nudiflora TaxID=2094558 RepID=A0A314XIM1_PRUYE|nr:NEP1-interacting protein-like 1 isoform X2 [Prunus yedoensis var. nudiflora]